MELTTAVVICLGVVMICSTLIKIVGNRYHVTNDDKTTPKLNITENNKTTNELSTKIEILEKEKIKAKDEKYNTKLENYQKECDDTTAINTLKVKIRSLEYENKKLDDLRDNALEIQENNEKLTDKVKAAESSNELTNKAYDLLKEKNELLNKLLKKEALPQEQTISTNRRKGKYVDKTDQEVISMFDIKHGRKNLTRTQLNDTDNHMYCEINRRKLMDKIIPTIAGRKQNNTEKPQQKTGFELYSNDEIIEYFNNKHGHRDLARTEFYNRDHKLYFEVNRRKLMDKLIPKKLPTTIKKELDEPEPGIYYPDGSRSLVGEMTIADVMKKQHQKNK